MENWDLIIIGGGPAGLAAGIYGARSGLKTLVLDEELAGGTASDAPLIENYPSFQKISGAELAQKMALHCKSAGAVVHEFEQVLSLDLKGNAKLVKTNRATYEAKAVVIASGSHYLEVGIPGEKEFRGRGVSYCGVCDGPLFRGKRVLVIGGGNSALITALYLAELVSEVKIAHRRDVFRAEHVLVEAVKAKENVEVLWSSEVKEIKGDKLVNRVAIVNKETGESREVPFDGVFVQIGETPNTQQAKEADVDVDEDGYIKIDARQHTNIAGVFAAGDVTNHPVKQIGTAVGQGITAALEAYGYIKRPYYYKQ
jgi:thioredoxin reductase (NADPH)